MRVLVLGFTNPVGRVSEFGLRWYGWCMWGVCRWLGSGSEGVV